MNEFQEKLLPMMEWFHTFCVNKDLRYYALGGTMLGAMRHNGFIPWDDDIDIGMPRRDYERLAEIFDNSDNLPYMLEMPSSDAKDYCYPYAKLFDKNTTLVENQKYKIRRGIFIDIFPLDGLGNTLEEAKKNYKKLELYRNLLLLKTSSIRKGRSFYKNIAIILFRCVPINEKKLLKKVSNIGNVYNFDSCKFGGNAFGAWRFKEIMPVEYMGIPKLYDFETIKIYGSEFPNDYLTYLYGDWKKMPPKEKQITHHDFIFCDLNKSWLNE